MLINVEAYEEFKHVLLALTYVKDDQTSPVANEFCYGFEGFFLHQYKAGVTLLQWLRIFHGIYLNLVSNLEDCSKAAPPMIQAIVSMMVAQDGDPKNLEVLLALGVSHTNELEQAAALKYLYGWLQNHPKYGTIAPPERSNYLYYADVARLFNEAAQISPDDVDVHIVLGVLYNISREYDKAIGSYQTALKLKPRDYSLWNKLGATQANSVQSAEAISFYQQ
ncbi:hypothetical protein GIB67_026139, partial [Kingdonia uniflora]